MVLPCHMRLLGANNPLIKPGAQAMAVQKPQLHMAIYHASLPIDAAAAFAFFSYGAFPFCAIFFHSAPNFFMASLASRLPSSFTMGSLSFTKMLYALGALFGLS